MLVTNRYTGRFCGEKAEAELIEDKLMADNLDSLEKETGKLTEKLGEMLKMASMHLESKSKH